MRVVAGQLRGRKIVAPDGVATRPTTDKVREAVFNALGSLDVVQGALVADLYAGSGALGIEALSRGADHCTFVERDRYALRALRSNVAELGLDDRSKVVSGDVLTFANSLDVDVAFADPPYGFEAWPRLFSLLRVPLVVAESGHELSASDLAPAPADGDASVAPQWQITRSKRYGRAWVAFVERHVAS